MTTLRHKELRDLIRLTQDTIALAKAKLAAGGLFEVEARTLQEGIKTDIETIRICMEKLAQIESHAV